MTSTSSLGSLTLGIAGLRGRLDVLTRQTSDGRRAALYGDAAADVPRTVSLRGEIGARTAAGAAISIALGRTGVAQTALSRLGAIATDFSHRVAQLAGNPATLAATTAAAARQAMAEVAGLLDTQVAGTYVFGGSDTANPPVPDPDAIAGSGFATAIAGAVAGLTPTNAAAIGAATLAAASSDAAGTTPFSVFLSDPARGLTEPRATIPTGEGSSVPVGLSANRNAIAASAGETTGSWARDLLRGLATLAGVGPAQAAQGAGFTALLATVSGSLRSASAAMGEEAGGLGESEARLTAARTRGSDLATTLATQLSNLEDVDLASTITQLQDTQTKLAASYKAISELAGLTLTNFLK